MTEVDERLDKVQHLSTPNAEVFPAIEKSISVSTTAITSFKRHRSASSSTSSLDSLFCRLQGVKPSATPNVEGRFTIKNSVECGCNILAQSLSPDGSTIAAAMRDASVVLLPWSSNVTSATERIPPPPSMSFGSATSVIWHPLNADTLIVTYSDGRMMSYGRSNKSPLTDMNIPDAIDLKVSAIQGATLLTYTRDRIELRDPHTLRVVTTFRTRVAGQYLGGYDSIMAVTGRGVEVIGGGAGIVWWDSRTADVTRKAAGANVRGDALSLHPTADRLLVGGWVSSKVSIWDSTNAKILSSLHSDAADTSVYAACWLGRDMAAYGGLDGNLLRGTTFENQTVGVLRGLRAPVVSIKSSPSRGSGGGVRMSVASGTVAHMVEVTK